MTLSARCAAPKQLRLQAPGIWLISCATGAEERATPLARPAMGGGSHVLQVGRDACPMPTTSSRWACAQCAARDGLLSARTASIRSAFSRSLQSKCDAPASATLLQVRRSCKCDAACFVPTFADAMATRRGACSPSLLAYNDTLAVVRWGAEHTSHHRSASASSPFRDLLIASATRVLPAHLASAARGRGRQRGV